MPGLVGGRRGQARRGAVPAAGVAVRAAGRTCQVKVNKQLKVNKRLTHLQAGKESATIGKLFAIRIFEEMNHLGYDLGECTLFGM